MTTRYTFERTYLYERFHVSLGAKRTTISIDKTLSILMSLQLGAPPNTPDAHLTLRQWLQMHLDRNGDPQQTNISHWLRGKIAEALIGADLKHKYDQWCEAEWIKHYPPQARDLTARDHSL
jgi:hypothetical protein